MATIRKRGKRYIAEVRRQGFYQSKQFDSKLEAQAWAVQVEQSLGKHGGVVSGKTLGQAMDKYAKECSPGKKGARWEIVRLEKLQRDPLADISLLRLTSEDVEAWIKRQTHLEGSSINRELTIISAVLKAARRWKWVSNNIMPDVQRPKDPPHRTRRIAPTEHEALLLALGYRKGAFPATAWQETAVTYMLALETAMRQGEIYNLQWECVHLEKRYVHLPDTKNGTSRDVPLSSVAIELLHIMKPQKAGRVFKTRQASAGQIFRRACVLAKIENLHFHDTRHEALTRMAKTFDMMTLARISGHRDPRSLFVYYNPTAEELASKLSPSSPIP